MTPSSSSLCRLLVATLLAGIPSCMQPSGGCPDTDYESTTANPMVRLPVDESPHCFGGVEWWYYSGQVFSDDGSRYGIHAVVFHVPREPLIGFNEGWVAHYAVLDADRQLFEYDQRAMLGPAPNRSTRGAGFEIDMQLVQARGFDGQDGLSARMDNGRYSLQLELTDVAGAILHEVDGYVPYGANGRSFYYSRPSMAAAGTLEIDGEVTPVTGEFWFDRQWGRSLDDPSQPWDWYSIRLDDGSRLMLFVFPGNEGPVAFGSFVPAQGETVNLMGSDFVVTSREEWTSSRTGISYDIAWTIDVPALNLELVVDALHDNQEIYARATTLNTYWEGLCDVAGTLSGQAVSGHAFVEQANGGAER